MLQNTQKKERSKKSFSFINTKNPTQQKKETRIELKHNTKLNHMQCDEMINLYNKFTTNHDHSS